MRTLDCATLGVLLSAYVDGELVGEDRDAFEAHLRQCVPCGAAVDAELGLMRLIRSAGPLHRAPARLCEAVMRTLASPRPAAARWWKAAAAAGLLLALAVGPWRQAPRPRPVAVAASSGFATLGVDTNLRHVRGQLPLEVRSDRPEEVTGWFDGRVPFQLALPAYPVGQGQTKPYTLVGGRLISFHGDYAAYVVYRMDERPISLLVTTAAAVQPEGGVQVMSGPLTFHLESVAGLKVITWMDRGLTYALVSDLREDGAQSCLVCHGTDQERRKLDGLRRPPVS